MQVCHPIGYKLPDNFPSQENIKAEIIRCFNLSESPDCLCPSVYERQAESLFYDSYERGLFDGRSSDSEMVCGILSLEKSMRGCKLSECFDPQEWRNVFGKLKGRR